MTMTASALTSTHGRVRRAFAYITTGLPALVVLAFGGQLLATGWTTNRVGGTHHVHDLAWGALEGVLLLGALGAMLMRKGRRPAVLLQALAVIAALVVTMGLVASFDPFTLVLGGLVVTAVLLWSPGGLLQDRDPSSVMLALTGVTAVPLGIWAVSAASDQRTSGDEHAELIGYTGVTAYALALVAVLAVASLRQPGWRWTAACASVSTAVVGVAGMLWPDDASSPGTLGGLGLIVLAAVTGGLALRHRRA